MAKSSGGSGRGGRVITGGTAPLASLERAATSLERAVLSGRYTEAQVRRATLAATRAAVRYAHGDISAGEALRVTRALDRAGQATPYYRLMRSMPRSMAEWMAPPNMADW